MNTNNDIKNKPYFQLIIVALLGVLVYSNTFDVPFQLDDKPNITANLLIKDVKNIPSLLAGGSGTFSSRPLMHVTFAVNYIFGGLDTTGYHAVNIGLHILNGILLYLLVLITGKHLGHEGKDVRAVASMSAAIFVLHPVQTEAVTNVVNRSMLLATTFYLSGLMLYFKALTAERRRGIYIAGLFLVSLLGMGSRENYSTFPIMLIFYDIFFISSFSLKEVVGHYKAYLPVFLSLAYMAYLVMHATYSKRAAVSGIPPVEYVLTQFKVHWTYLRLLLLPVNQNLDYGYPVAKRLFELPTLLSLSGYAALWTGSVIMAKKRPVSAFLVLWFLITLLPVSFLLALTDLKLGDVIFEHRLYLPGIGAIVFAGILIFSFLKILYTKREVARIVLIPSCFMFIAVFAICTYARNAVWDSERGLWEDVVKKSPINARAYSTLGLIYATQGVRDEAIRHFQKALTLSPDYVQPHVYLAMIYNSEGFSEKAEEHYRIAHILKPDLLISHNRHAFKLDFESRGHDNNYTLGLDYYKKGQTDKAIDYFIVAIREHPTFAEAHYHLGVAYGSKGMLDKSIEHYEAAVSIKPDLAEAHNNLGNAYKIKGQLDKATEHLKTASELNPDNAIVHYNLGLVYMEAGHLNKARTEFEIALKINPNLHQARDFISLIDKASQ